MTILQLAEAVGISAKAVEKHLARNQYRLDCPADVTVNFL